MLANCALCFNFLLVLLSDYPVHVRLSCHVYGATAARIVTSPVRWQQCQIAFTTIIYNPLAHACHRQEHVNSYRHMATESGLAIAGIIAVITQQASFHTRSLLAWTNPIPHPPVNQTYTTTHELTRLRRKQSYKGVFGSQPLQDADVNLSPHHYLELNKYRHNKSILAMCSAGTLHKQT